MPENSEIGEVSLQKHMEAVSGKTTDNVIPFPNAVPSQARELNANQAGFAERLRRVLQERFPKHSAEDSLESASPQKPPSGKAF